MSKRLVKRHKRQVSRAKQHARLSEPDVRTPEQIKAARDASRPTAGWRTGPQGRYSAPSIKNHAGPPAHNATETDGKP